MLKTMTTPATLRTQPMRISRSNASEDFAAQRKANSPRKIGLWIFQMETRKAGRARLLSRKPRSFGKINTSSSQRKLLGTTPKAFVKNLVDIWFESMMLKSKLSLRSWPHSLLRMGQKVTPYGSMPQMRKSNQNGTIPWANPCRTRTGMRISQTMTISYSIMLAFVATWACGGTMMSRPCVPASFASGKTRRLKNRLFLSGDGNAS